MKEVISYPWDLQILLDEWRNSLSDLDFVGSANLEYLKIKLIDLFNKYQEYNDSYIEKIHFEDNFGDVK